MTRGSYCRPVSNRLGVASGLNKDFEPDAVLVDGTPETVLHALDTDEDPRPCAICRLAIADEVADGRRSSRRISCRSVAPSRRRRRYRVLLKISSTSRRL